MEKMPIDTVLCEKRKVNFAVAETAANFNSGAGSKAVLLESFGVSGGYSTINVLKLTETV